MSADTTIMNPQITLAEIAALPAEQQLSAAALLGAQQLKDRARLGGIRGGTHVACKMPFHETSTGEVKVPLYVAERRDEAGNLQVTADLSRARKFYGYKDAVRLIGLNLDEGWHAVPLRSIDKPGAEWRPLRDTATERGIGLV